MYRTKENKRKNYKYFYIYSIINKINGKQYVGQHADNIEEDGYFGSGKLLEKAIKKYGKENFIKEILENFTEENILNDREIYWIKELNTKIPNGYNLTDGGENNRGFEMTPETCKKISDKAKGRPTWNKGLRGVYSEKSLEKMKKSQQNRPPASPETCKKLSDANTGKKHSEETKQKLSVQRLGDLNPAKNPETKAKISKKLKGKFIGESNPMAKSSRKREKLLELELMGIKLSGDMHEYLRRKIICTNIETKTNQIFDGVQLLLKTLKINKRKYYAHLKDGKPILGKYICKVY